MTTITIERAVLLRALEALRPATAPNGAKRDAAFEDLRAALAAPATAPEKTVQEIMEFARHYAADTFSSATLEDKIRRSLAASATAPAQPEIVDLLAEMYELILANKVVLAEKSGGVWTWPDRAIEAVRKHRSGPAQPERKPKPFIGTRSAIYKCTDCGHEQSVQEIHTEYGVYVGSGANWCDKCGDGKPERKETP